MDSEPFDLSIKTLKGEVFTVNVSSKDTVSRAPKRLLFLNF